MEVKKLLEKLNNMRSKGIAVKVREPEEYAHDVKKPSNDEYELAKYKEKERQEAIKDELKTYKREEDKAFTKPDTLTSQPNSVTNQTNSNFKRKINTPNVTMKKGVEKRVQGLIGGGMTIGRNNFQPQNDDNILNAGNSFFQGARPLKQSKYQNVFIR